MARNFASVSNPSISASSRRADDANALPTGSSSASRPTARSNGLASGSSRPVQRRAGLRAGHLTRGWRRRNSASWVSTGDHPNQRIPAGRDDLRRKCSVALRPRRSPALASSRVIRTRSSAARTRWPSASHSRAASAHSWRRPWWSRDAVLSALIAATQVERQRRHPVSGSAAAPAATHASMSPRGSGLPTTRRRRRAVLASTGSHTPALARIALGRGSRSRLQQRQAEAAVVVESKKKYSGVPCSLLDAVTG